MAMAWIFIFYEILKVSKRRGFEFNKKKKKKQNQNRKINN